MENIEIFFAENPDTPPRTTNKIKRTSNWHKRINKAKEQAKLKPVSFSKVFAFANEFINMLGNESDKKKSMTTFALDDKNQAIILDKGIIACASSWKETKWNEEEKKYEEYDSKYDEIKKDLT